eukprot:s37_g42.t1
MYVGEDVSPDFYAWVFPKCDHVAVGTGTVVDKKGIQRYQQGIRDRAATRIDGGEIIRDRAILVGDAAGYVTKCSGEGIYFAAKSGMCAETIVKNSKQGVRMIDEADLMEHLREWDGKYGPTYLVLDLLQKVFYTSDAARESFVELCEEEYVQKVTFETWPRRVTSPAQWPSAQVAMLAELVPACTASPATAATPKVVSPRPQGHGRWQLYTAALSGLVAARATGRGKRAQRRAQQQGGVDVWRSLPGEIPKNMDVILRNRYNDVVLEELDDLDLSPFRTLAVIRLPIQWVPQVGQLRRQVFRQGSTQHLALKVALEEHGGFLGIAVDIPQATYLPRGCVGAEVVQLSFEEDLVHATLRGVSMLRIIDRVKMPDDHGIRAPLMQEVLEYTDLERKEGMEVLLEETKKVEKLFVHCGQLQKETGIFAAGDLSKTPLRTLAQAALENLADVNLCGVRQEEHRGPVVASHAAVFAFGVQKQADFLCDPFSALRRLRTLSRFLNLMDRVLTPKLHA